MKQLQALGALERPGKYSRGLDAFCDDDEFCANLGKAMPGTIIVAPVIGETLTTTRGFFHVCAECACDSRAITVREGK